MSENTVVHIGENSPEQIAYKLMHDIARAEKINLVGSNVNSNREWIIKTFIMCRQAAGGHTNVDHVLGLGR